MGTVATRSLVLAEARLPLALLLLNRVHDRSMATLDARLAR